MNSFSPEGKEGSIRKQYIKTSKEGEGGERCLVYFASGGHNESLMLQWDNTRAKQEGMVLIWVDSLSYIALIEKGH